MHWPQKLNSVSLTPTPGTLALERIPSNPINNARILKTPAAND
jgi:hypothetical protein